MLGCHFYAQLRMMIKLSVMCYSSWQGIINVAGIKQAALMERTGQ